MTVNEVCKICYRMSKTLVCDPKIQSSVIDLEGIKN